MNRLAGLLHSPKIQNVLKISGGTIAGQLIAVATLPFVTRIYGASRMGIWATMLAVAMLLQTFCDLGLENSIMIEPDADRAGLLYRLTGRLTALIALASLVVVVPYFTWVQHSGLTTGLILGGMTALYAYTLKQVSIAYTWLNRNKQYAVLMKNPILNYVTMAVVALGAGALGLLEYGYYAAMIAGQLVTLWHMRRHVPHRGGVGREAARAALADYRHLMLYQTPNNLMIQMREQVPNLAIGLLFGNTVLGYYAVSIKVLNMPINFIAQAVGKVFYQSLSELAWAKKSMASFIARNFDRAIALGVVPVLGLFAFGDVFAVLFFGGAYLMAGEILRLVVFRAFFTFVSVCMQSIDIVLAKQHYTLAATVSQTALGVLSIVLGAVGHSVMLAIALLVVSYIVIQLIYYQALFATQDIRMRRHYAYMLLCLIGVLGAGWLLRAGFAAVVGHWWPAAFAWFRIW